jgi:hypothetical protein
LLVQTTPTTTTTHITGEEEEETDNPELAVWAQTHHAQKCRHCRIWIVRADGCDAMMSLCGYRVCWACRAATDNNERCTCAYEEFYNNLTGDETTVVRSLATPRELADFSTFLQRLQEAHSDSEDDDEEEDSTIVEEPPNADCVPFVSMDDDINGGYDHERNKDARAGLT